jgi:hypothetical protein
MGTLMGIVTVMVVPLPSSELWSVMCSFCHKIEKYQKYEFKLELRFCSTRTGSYLQPDRQAGHRWPPTWAYGKGWPWTSYSFTRNRHGLPFYALRAGHRLTAISVVAVFNPFGHPTPRRRLWPPIELGNGRHDDTLKSPSK